MRFLSSSSLVMLTLFSNYIRISSGMNQRENAGKTLSLFSESPESLGIKPRNKPAMEKVVEENDERQFPNEDKRKFGDVEQNGKIADNKQTGKFVDHKQTGKSEDDELARDRTGGKKTRRVDPLPKMNLSMRTDAFGHMRLFNHDVGRFDEDSEPYKPGTVEYNLAQEIQMAYQRYSKSKLNGKERVLLPKLSLSGGYGANFLNRAEHKPYVRPQSPAHVFVRGPNPYFYNQGHHGLYQAPPNLPNLPLPGISAFHPYNSGPPGPPGSGHQP